MHLVIIKKMTSNITTPATCAQPPRNQDEGVYIAHGGKIQARWQIAAVWRQRFGQEWHT